MYGVFGVVEQWSVEMIEYWNDAKLIYNIQLIFRKTIKFMTPKLHHSNTSTLRHSNYAKTTSNAAFILTAASSKSASVCAAETKPTS